VLLVICIILAPNVLKHFRVVTAISCFHTVPELHGLFDQVFMGDYGFCEWVEKPQLRSIHKHFTERQWFSARCHLAGIRSLSPGRQWGAAACEAIVNLICGKKVFLDIKVVRLVIFMINR
jgi:Tudor domain